MPSPASPARPTPISATPAVTSGKRKSKVMQSSLELVFSYSRSQQALYGRKLGSVPSFVDTPSRSWPSLDGYGSTRSPNDVEYGPGPSLDEESEEDEEEEADRELDDQGRRSSGEPWLFPSPEHDYPTPPPQETQERQSRANSKDSDPTPRPGLLTLTSPKPPLEAILGTSLGSVGSRRSVKKLGGGSYGFGNAAASGSGNGNGNGVGSHPGRRAFEGVSPKDEVPGAVDEGAVEDEGRGTEDVVLNEGVLGEDKVVKIIEQTEDTPLLSNARRRSSARSRRMSGLSRRRSQVEMRRRQSIAPKGESTEGQTLFNAVAVLVGIGLLSLPLAFSYAGWIGGTIMLVGFAWITCHTAKLLAKLIRADWSLVGYTDIGRRAFGRWGGIGINLLFCLELFALGVALVVLFGDSLEPIYPRFSATTYMMFGFFIIFPTTLLPLSLLSLPSLLSTLSSLLLVLILILDAIIVHRPPAPTSWTPEWTHANWLGGIGLVLAGFGGHAVVPSLARDMKVPERFDAVINKAFIIATVISFVAGSVGYIMIGDGVSDEITRDLMRPENGYPRALNVFALWMIVVNPVTKFGLCSRPLNVTIESILSISPTLPHRIPNTSQTPTDLSPNPKSPSRQNSSAYITVYPNTAKERQKGAWRVLSRLVVTLGCVGTAVVLPGFGRVMAFLGSFSAFLICIILPLGFWLRLSPALCPEATSRIWRWVYSAILAVSGVLMVCGTGWSFVHG